MFNALKSVVALIVSEELNLFNQAVNIFSIFRGLSLQLLASDVQEQFSQSHAILWEWRKYSSSRSVCSPEQQTVFPR